MKRFEYKTIVQNLARGLVKTALEKNAGGMNELLNVLGADGWELVSALLTKDGPGELTEVVMILKREIG